MLAFTLFYQLSAIVFFSVLTYPNLPPDPALIAQLEQARPAVSGQNGYAALRAIPLKASDNLPKDLPRCGRDTPDCLAQAREHLAGWRAIAPAWRETWQMQDAMLDALRQYDYFRPLPEQYNGKTWPTFVLPLLGTSLNAYRFAAGEHDAALHGACRDAKLGLRFIQSHGLVLQSLVGIALVERNIALLAQMRAELPPDAPLPADCGALQAQPAEIIALCPLMYADWLGYSEAMREADAEVATSMKDDAEKSFYFITARQMRAQTLYENSRYCAPEILAAIARDEVRIPAPERWPKYCSPINTLCRFAWHDRSRDQAGLLNANRYLRAFALLRHPNAPLPPGYSRDGDTLTFTLHPEQRDKNIARTVTLSLPGSRVPQ